VAHEIIVEDDVALPRRKNGRVRKYASNKEYRRAWVLANPAKRKEILRKSRARPEYKAKQAGRARVWRETNYRQHREYHLQKCYGISLEEYDKLLALQLGVCATCDTQHDVSKPLTVDHSHDTGRVRGLLCDGCNRSLATAKENPQILRALAEYLETRDG
jgi:hypothetical protein